jgi:hypothetical protein
MTMKTTPRLLQVGCVMAILCAVGSGSAVAMPAEDAVSQDATEREANEHERQVDELVASIEKRDFKTVAALVQSAYNDWRKPANQAVKEWRGQHLDETLGQCFSRGSSEAEAIGREWARKALSSTDDMGAAVELHLTLHAISGVVAWAPRGSVRKVAVEPAVRSQSARLSCHALARFEKEYDPTWTPGANRQRVVNPMFFGPGAELQRTRYDEETAAIGLRDVKQLSLHRAKKDLVPWIERYLAKLYSQPPQATGELKKYLREKEVSQETIDRILDQVQEPETTTEAD